MDQVKKTKIRIIELKNNESIYKITSSYLFIKKIKEIYLSEIKKKSTKSWKFSEETCQNICVFNSKIKILYKEKKEDSIKSINLDKKNSFMVKITKNYFYTFVNLDNKKGFILNFLNKKYKKKN